jgi:hypothetical protein
MCRPHAAHAQEGAEVVGDSIQPGAVVGRRTLLVRRRGRGCYWWRSAWCGGWGCAGHGGRCSCAGGAEEVGDSILPGAVVGDVQHTSWHNLITTIGWGTVSADLSQRMRSK